MSDVRREPPSTAPTSVPADTGPVARESSAWAGWVLFGAMMMILLGTMQAIAGLVALVDDTYYAVAPSGLVVDVSYTAWGWVHLVVGLTAAAAGFGLFGGARWARVLGVAVAMASAVVNFAFVAAYPLWCLTMIGVDVLVIYAITAHGSEAPEKP